MTREPPRKVVAVPDVGAQDPLGMAAADDQESVEAFRAYGADRTARRRRSHRRLHRGDSFAAENGNVVESVCLDPSL